MSRINQWRRDRQDHLLVERAERRVESLAVPSLLDWAQTVSTNLDRALDTWRLSSDFESRDAALGEARQALDVMSVIVERLDRIHQERRPLHAVDNRIK